MWTARLRGVAPTDSHLDDFERLLNNPQVARTLGGLRSRVQVEQSLQSNIDHWREHGFGAWMLADRATGAFVGRGGLKFVEIDGRQEIEVLYALLPEYWGRGLATEVAVEAIRIGFEELKASGIIGFTLVDNAASRNVLEKAGLVFERPIQHAGLPHVLYRIGADS